MRILLVGSGGREHALAWAISASPLCDTLIGAPGNAGIAEIARCVPVAASDIEGLVTLARAERVDFTVVGPEQPQALQSLLAEGLAVAGQAQAPAGERAFNSRGLEGDDRGRRCGCSRFRGRDQPVTGFRPEAKFDGLRDFCPGFDLHREG